MAGSVYEGKTFDEAVKKGLDALRLTRAEAVITTVEAGKGGFLGFGARPFRVSVARRPGGAIKEPAEREDRGGPRGGRTGGRDERAGRGGRNERGGRGGRDDKPAARGGRDEARPAKEEPKAARDDRGGRGGRDEKREKAPVQAREERAPRPPREERPAREDRPAREERVAREERAPRPPREERRPPEPVVVAGAPVPPEVAAEGGDDSPRKRRRRGRRGGRGRRRGGEGGPEDVNEAAPQVMTNGAQGFAPTPHADADDEFEDDDFDDAPKAAPIVRAVAPAPTPVQRAPEPVYDEPTPVMRAPEPIVESRPEAEPVLSSGEPVMDSPRFDRGGRGDRGHRRERGRDRGERGDRVERSEQTGEEGSPIMNTEELIAASRRHTEELLRHMGFEPKVEVRCDGNRVDVTVEVDHDDELLNGRRGETRDALQHLLNRFLNKGDGSRYHLQLEVNGFWLRREEELAGLAKKLADQAVAEQAEIVTEQMNSQERRIIHVTLKEDTRVRTFSLGDGMVKRVAIAPADFPERTED